MKKYKEFIIETAPLSTVTTAPLSTVTTAPISTVTTINLKKYKDILNMLNHFWFSLKKSLINFGKLDDKFIDYYGNEVDRTPQNVMKHNNLIRKTKGSRPIEHTFVKVTGENYYYEVRSIDDVNNTAMLWNLDIPLGNSNSTTPVEWNKIQKITDKNELNIASHKKATINPSSPSKPNIGDYCKIEGNNDKYYKVINADVGNKSSEIWNLDLAKTDHNAIIKVEWKYINIIITRKEQKIAQNKEQTVGVAA